MADEMIVNELKTTSTVDHDGSTSAWRARLQAMMGELDARARELVEQGNHRRLVVKQGDRTYVDLPLTAVAALGAVGVVVSPQGMVAAVLAAALARVNAHIEG